MSTEGGAPAGDEDGDYQISYYSDSHIEHKRIENIEKELINMKHGLHGIYNIEVLDGLHHRHCMAYGL